MRIAIWDIGIPTALVAVELLLGRPAFARTDRDRGNRDRNSSKSSGGKTRTIVDNGFVAGP